MGLTLMFGGIVLVDNIKQNSKQTKRVEWQSEQDAQALLNYYAKERKQYLDKYNEIWTNSGASPDKWKN